MLRSRYDDAKDDDGFLYLAVSKHHCTAALPPHAAAPVLASCLHLPRRAAPRRSTKRTTAVSLAAARCCWRCPAVCPPVALVRLRVQTANRLLPCAFNSTRWRTFLDEQARVPRRGCTLCAQRCMAWHGRAVLIRHMATHDGAGRGTVHDLPLQHPQRTSSSPPPHHQPRVFRSLYTRFVFSLNEMI